MDINPSDRPFSVDFTLSFVVDTLLVDYVFLCIMFQCRNEINIQSKNRFL